MPNLKALRNKIMKETKQKVKVAYAKRDKLVIQAINALDELNNIHNQLVMRLREWYSLYFPELNKTIKDHSLYTNLVLRIDSLSGISNKDLKAAGCNDVQIKRILTYASNSMGADLKREDLAKIKEFAKRAKAIEEEKTAIEHYIESVMEDIAPNLTAIAGAKLGAHLIAHAGSLEKLAILPSSTIQIMGAEKALFRHLKQGKNPPKHGLIFQSSYISGAPKKIRGKIARALAAKISIAVKEDYFGNPPKNLSKKLLKELNERIEQIKAKE